MVRSPQLNDLIYQMPPSDNSNWRGSWRNEG